jgi:hypothetical protein
MTLKLKYLQAKCRRIMKFLGGIGSSPRSPWKTSFCDVHDCPVLAAESGLFSGLLAAAFAVS